MKYLTTRRTIRQYSDQEVSEALLNRLMTEAARTQTMGNLQLYSVVVTRSQEMKQRLAPAHFNQPMVTSAPVVLTICADFNRTSVWARNRKAEPGYDNFLSYQNAAIDALLYTQTLCNLMDEEGLGYCYLGTTVYMPQQIIDTLRLPRLVMPVATLTVGWPAEEPPLSDRLPLQSFVHSETYRDYTPQDIDNYYKRTWRRTVTSATSTTRRRWPRYSPTSATPARTTKPCPRDCSKPSSTKDSCKLFFYLLIKRNRFLKHFTIYHWRQDYPFQGGIHCLQIHNTTQRTMAERSALSKKISRENNFDLINPR